MKNETAQGTSREALAFILSFVKRHIPAVAAGVLVLMGVDLVQLIIPRIVQRTIDMLGNTTFSSELIMRNAAFILTLAFGMVVLRFFWRLFIMGTARRIEKEVREEMFDHLQGLGFSYFNRTRTGHLMALMVNDVNAIRMAAGPSFLAITDALFMGTLSLVFLLSINVRLTLFAVLPLPCIIFMIARYGPLIQTRFKAVQESFASISARTQEAFSGIRVVKGYVQEEHEVEEFEQKCEEYVQKNLRLIKIWGVFFPAVTLFAVFFPAVTLFASLSMAILYLVGGRSVILGDLSFGEFVSFSMYLGLLIWPVIAIGWVFMIFQRGIASSKRILELMQAEPDVGDSEGVLRDIELSAGNISIRNLSFSYSGEENVLQDVNLEIPAGSSLGIMGKPGSGKSTLVSLLFRLFPIQEGEVRVDGCDIHELPLSKLRSSIGYVPQDPFLFSDSIRNNITFGADEEKDLDRVRHYAEMTALSDEVMEFKEGFDTLVGERGVTLSGGQKQRVSIARALFIKPRILILDDALSSVDARAEREVLKNIRREMAGRTVIFISHRVSTVMECDSIIVLEGGKIVEQGSHRELLKRDRYGHGILSGRDRGQWEAL
jgi:ATP-binding cassette subfamily B protein